MAFSSKTNRFIIWNELNLDKTKSLIQNDENNYIKFYFNNYIQNANKLVNEDPLTVLDKKNNPPSLNKKDYLSIPIYWWPNPDTDNGLPYIRNDGFINPESLSMDNDRQKLGKLSKDVECLSLCCFFTDRKVFGKAAKTRINKWFLDIKTSMNPNLNFSQCPPGKNIGNKSGVIDGYQFIRILDSIILLNYLEIINQDELEKLQRWFNNLLNWLLSNENALNESNTSNNHAIYYDLQIIAFSYFCKRMKICRDTILKVKNKRIPNHININGQFPEELKRNRSFHYQAFTAKAFLDIHDISKRIGFNILYFKNKTCGSIYDSLVFHLGYANNHESWKFEQKDPFDTEKFFQNSLRVSNLTNDLEIFNKSIPYFNKHSHLSDIFLYPNSGNNFLNIQIKRGINEKFCPFNLIYKSNRFSKSLNQISLNDEDKRVLDILYKDFLLNLSDIEKKILYEKFISDEITSSTMTPLKWLICLVYLKSISNNEYSRAFELANLLLEAYEEHDFLGNWIFSDLNLILLKTSWRTGKINYTKSHFETLKNNNKLSDIKKSKIFFLMSQIERDTNIKESYIKKFFELVNPKSFNRQEFIYLSSYFFNKNNQTQLQNLKNYLPQLSHFINDDDLILADLFFTFYHDKDQYYKIISSYYAKQGLSSPLIDNSFLPLNILKKDKLKINKNKITDISNNKFCVTIVMTAFNAQDTISNSIISVLNQTHTNIKLVIVNDLSNDNTQKIIERFSNIDSRISYIVNTSNIGTYKSKNKAIDKNLLKTDYFTFHDSDDWMHPQRINLHLEKHINDKNIKSSSSKWIRFRDNDAISTANHGSQILHQNPCSLFFHKNIINDIGFFDGIRAGADSEYIARIINYYGNDSHININLPLSLGLKNNTSLTTSGASKYINGASLVRDKYKESWSAFHKKSILDNKLKDLKIEINQVHRKFEAPSGLQ